MDYYKELAETIIRKLIPDLTGTLTYAKNMKLDFQHYQVTIPLAADIFMLYERQLGAFTIEARCHNPYSTDRYNKYLMGRSVFSTKQLSGGKDAFDLIDHIFDNLKNQFKESILKEELKMLAPFRKGEGGVV